MGLSLVRFGLVLSFLCIGAEFLIFLAAHAKPGLTEDNQALLQTSATRGYVMGLLMTLGGSLLCLGLARASGALPLLAGALGCHLLVMLSNTGTFQKNSFNELVEGSLFGFLLGAILAMVSTILFYLLFLLFVRKVSQFITRSDLAARSRTLAIQIAILPAMVVFTIVVPFLHPDFSSVFSLLSLILSIWAFVLFLLFLGLLHRLKLGVRQLEQEVG
jgi:uncharacterized membrane protein